VSATFDEWTLDEALNLAKTSNESHVLQELVHHTNDRVVAALAARDIPWLVNQFTPIYPVAVLTAVARNPITSPDKLLAFSVLTYAAVRSAVARNPNALRYALSVFGGTPVPMGRKFSRDPSALVRRSLASNTHIALDPTAALVLSQDPVGTVRLRLAANPAAPPDLLHVLGEDDEFDVRRAVWRNPGATKRTRDMLGPEFPGR
jgi:hypothetical protein